MNESAADLHRQFDFWVGDWDLTWEGGTGHNHISAVLGGAVILEEFSADAPEELRGMSVSTVSSETGGWRQTWVDNSHGYLDFTGGMRDGEMILEREGQVKGTRVRQRMVWTDITADQLTWRWERSDDGGTTWRTLWQIQYRRAVGQTS